MGSRRSRAIPPEPRFWAKVDKGDGTGCWLWTAAVDINGYGAFGVLWPKVVKAHRYSWELANGPIPPRLFVCHRCDVPQCVRPEHLFLGTQVENMADARAKGRIAAGDRAPKRAHPERYPLGPAAWNGRLSEADVASIRARNSERDSIIAADFGISAAYVSVIQSGKARRHG